jgi:hypothetical protein
LEWGYELNNAWRRIREILHGQLRDVL